jgi:hypothetical protein
VACFIVGLAAHFDNTEYEGTFMEEKEIAAFIEHFRAADMAAIGIGHEFEKISYEKAAMIMDFFNPYLEHKNFFVITSCTDMSLPWDRINPKRFVNPVLYQEEGTDEELKQNIEKQWDLYNKWLSSTLNKNLLILELGEGFRNPGIFRWPFEKVVFVNQKSMLYRINQTFPQIPENINERAVSIAQASEDFLTDKSQTGINKVKL